MQYNIFSSLIKLDGDDILYVRIPHTLDDTNAAPQIDAVLEHIYNASARGSFHGKRVIIRDGMQLDTPYTDRKIKQLFAKSDFAFRLRSLTAQFLTTRGKKIVSLQLSSEARLAPIAAIGAAVLAHRIGDSYTEYRADKGSVFMAPSGHYTEAFFRVGNVQSSLPVLDDIFFFLFESLYGARSVISETWSISTVCHHIAHRLRDRYDAVSPTAENRVVVRFLASYFDGKVEASVEIERIVIELLERQKLPAVILFSAVFTGSSWAAMKAAAEGLVARSAFGSRLKKPLLPLALLGLKQDAAVDCLTYLPNATLDLEKDDIRSIIPVDRTTYFPDFSQPVDVPIYPHTQRYRSFYERYAGFSLFDLHRDSSRDDYRGRHNAFHIDADRMFATAAFRSRLKLALKGAKKPDVLITLATKANDTLVGLVQSIFESSALVIRARTVDELTDKLPIGAKGHSLQGNVWIVESVSITGGTLGAYAKWLRDVFDKQTVTYLVGVNRPDGEYPDPEVPLRNLLFTNDGASNLKVVETVVLPNWGIERCPWCREKSLLATSNAPSGSSLEKTINLRKYSLDRTLIQSGAFLSKFRDNKSYESAFKLGRDSLFFDTKKCSLPEDINEADIISAVATTSELWRAAGRPYRKETPIRGAGSRRVSVASIIGPTTFTDPVIKAAIWRTFSADELFPAVPKKLIRIYSFFGSIINKSNNLSTVHSLSLEALLLLARRASHVPIDVTKLTRLEKELLRIVAGL